MKEQIVQYIRRCAGKQSVESVGKIIDELADEVNGLREPMAKRTMEMLPFLLGGRVARPVWVCGNCHARVIGSDRFCHECGRRFAD